MARYTFVRNKFSNNVDISLNGIVLYRWTLSGNYERAFTIHTLTRLLGPKKAMDVVLQDLTVEAEIPDKKFGVYLPNAYNRISTSALLWAKLKRFLTRKE